MTIYECNFVLVYMYTIQVHILYMYTCQNQIKIKDLAYGGFLEYVLNASGTWFLM